MTRVPLSVKLIVVTTMLLTAAVGASASFSLGTIHALAQREAASRRSDGEAAIARQSELLARNVANSAALPLADGNFTYLDTLVTQTVKEDARIKWLVIADAGSRRIVARSAEAPRGERLDDTLGKAVAATEKVVSERTPDGLLVFGMKIQVGAQTIGELRLAVSTAALEADMARAIAAAEADARASTRNVWLIAGVILLVGMVLAAWQGFRIARPLALLSEQAHRIADGDLAKRVDIDSSDEIGRLANDFNFMAEQLQAQMAEAGIKASLEREMSLAREVQQAMIPAPSIHRHAALWVIGHCEPATACGGDWWTLRRLSNDRMLIVVGDVTGHGIPSAMVAATARGAVEALASVDERRLTPHEVLGAIDAAIRGTGASQLLMTCFAAVVDSRLGQIEFSNAGHNFPYILHRGAAGTIEELSVLAMRGSPLGAAGEPAVLQSGNRALKPGDVLVFYTDGVIDRVDAVGNRFGDRRLRHMFLHRTIGPDGAGITELRDAIIGQMSTFAAGQPADDDVTLVLCHFDPQTSSQAKRAWG